MVWFPSSGGKHKHRPRLALHWCLVGMVGAGVIHLGVFPEHFIFLELQEPLRAAACPLTCFKEEKKKSRLLVESLL